MNYPVVENRCGNCRWYNPTHGSQSYWNGSTKVDGAHTKGQCRRLPPVTLMPGGSSTPKTAWPEVVEVEWCGSFATIITEDIEAEVTTWAEAPP